ncbi:hypothetical protein J6590_090077 [Homalodisca vitripennis]|nr:hypothetical protein J6590_090077 [Homalodisca vitripennis]
MDAVLGRYKYSIHRCMDAVLGTSTSFTADGRSVRYKYSIHRCKDAVLGTSTAFSCMDAVLGTTFTVWTSGRYKYRIHNCMDQWQVQVQNSQLYGPVAGTSTEFTTVWTSGSSEVRQHSQSSGSM